jgi:hypothetical protein
LAVGAALVAWRVSQRLLDVEQRRDARREELAFREQAELFFVVGAKLPDRDDTETWAIALYNGSTKPIFDVRVESQRLDGSAANPVLKLGAVPPGRFVVPSHPTYHWGSLIDLDRTDERIDYLLKGKGTSMIQRVCFRDAARRQWELENGTGLGTVDEG